MSDEINIQNFDEMTPEQHAQQLAQMRDQMKALFNAQYGIKVQVLEDGKLPSKKNPKDAGFDLFATSDVTIRPGEVVKHPLNIKMELPKESWGRVESKSGLGAKGLLVYAGVIDEEYRGIPHVVMTNVNHLSGEPIVIKKNTKLAQLTMNPHSTHFFIIEVDEVNTDTARGEGGFGSTGEK